MCHQLLFQTIHSEAKQLNSSGFRGAKEHENRTTAFGVHLFTAR